MRQPQLAAPLIWMLLAGLPGSFPAPAEAQTRRVELLTFQSTTVTEQQFLTGERSGTPVTLAGELTIPISDVQRLPVAVIVHAGAGIWRTTNDLPQQLNEAGIATFVFDSFTPRGIIQTMNDQDQFSWLNMVGDSYRALEVVAKHRRVDPQRIVVIGWSRVALYASMKRFQRMYGRNDVAFAAYVAMHPSCATTFLEDENLAERPIRIFHGGADDWQPARQCRDYVDRARKAGADIQLMEYPGALHAFDWSPNATPVRFEKAQTPRKCRLEEAPGGRVVNSQNREPFTYDDACVERGVTLGYDSKASSEAHKAITDLIRGLGQK